MVVSYVDCVAIDYFHHAAETLSGRVGPLGRPANTVRSEYRVVSTTKKRYCLGYVPEPQRTWGRRIGVLERPAGWRAEALKSNKVGTQPEGNAELFQQRLKESIFVIF